MKKESISVDFVLFRERNDDVKNKLTVFKENIESSAGSHIAIISSQLGLLSNQPVTSPILNNSGAGRMSGASEGGYSGGFELGIDPSIDSELALALRMSMEEEQARVNRQNRERAEAEAEASLPEIKEEDEASQSPLNEEGEASGSKDSCS